MGCPHPLRAHQIRGLDFASIHPVIRWLVTKVLEVRKEVCYDLVSLSLFF